MVGVRAHGGVVAAGHPVTLAAARDTLARGGNAFDAAVAAGFAAAVAEPSLTSLAGGGFLLAAPRGADEVLFDFFVDTPGRGHEGPGATTVPVTVRFPGADQDFHVGHGAIATPGCLAGYLHVHDRLGRLELAEVVAPAIVAAREGVVLGPGQAAVVRLLEPIMTREPAGRALYGGPGGTRFGDDQRVVNLGLAGFLEDVAAGRRRGFGDDDLAPRIADEVRRGGGVLGVEDLASYRVIEREPLVAVIAGARVATNPAPSFGGELVVAALRMIEDPAAPRGAPGTAARAVRLADVLDAIDRAHRTRAPEATPRPVSRRGTTHVSVADSEGNVASMTTSNGSTGGVHLADTGVMANNIMGEEDLHPHGFGVLPAGVRVGSMMAPTIVRHPGRPTVALGSGGSERIRSALTQVLTALLLDDADLDVAVDAPRMHVASDTVHLEPGCDDEVVAALVATRTVNVWPAKDLYFGGVNAVTDAGAHVGDARRGGTSIVLPARP
jgi:gamma-glutamyltranspeptidase/glutathione hydrolase